MWVISRTDRFKKSVYRKYVSVSMSLLNYIHSEPEVLGTFDHIPYCFFGDNKF